VKYLYVRIQCVFTFNSVKHLRFHLLNIYYSDFFKELSVLEISKKEDNTGLIRIKRPRRSNEKPNQEDAIKGEYYLLMKPRRQSAETGLPLYLSCLLTA
jgi:hypothetical protein